MTLDRSDRTANGMLRVWTHGESSRILFRKCADVLTQEFGADGRDRFDGGDQLYWDYLVSGLPVTLHLDQALGIALVAGEQSAPCEALIRTMAASLRSRA